jgi:phosphatidylglycerophosphate synthase
VTNCNTALILCPDGDPSATVERRLLGLTVGERLLLALSHAGVERVAFLGPGNRPRSARAVLETFDAENAEAPERFWLLPADLVFDRALLQSADDLPGELALRCMPASSWEAVRTDPLGFLSLLGPGAATSGKRFALRVTDRQRARRAGRALRLALRKPLDGVISRNLNRPISTTVSRLLVRLGATPNLVTIVVAQLGLASAVLAALAEPWWVLLLAGLLFQAQSIFDGCDGEVARLTYRFSPRGAWLDTLGDDLTNYLFCLGLAIGQARVHELPWLYVAGGVTFAFQWATSGIMYQRLIKMGTGDMLALPNLVTRDDPEGFVGHLLKLGRIVSKRDFFVFTIAVLTAAQLPLVAFVTMAVGTYPSFLGVLVNELRIRKQQGA